MASFFHGFPWFFIVFSLFSSFLTRNFEAFLGGDAERRSEAAPQRRHRVDRWLKGGAPASNQALQTDPLHFSYLLSIYL